MKILNSSRILVFFPIILFPILLFIIPILGGRALFWGTPALQFVPWQSLAWDQLSQGVFPLWNPYNGFGAPLLANYQLGLFYPPNWLLFLCYLTGGPERVAWGYSLLVVFHLIIAGAGMAKLSAVVGYKPFAQAVSGVAFGLCSFLVTRNGFFSLVFAAAWMPWVIWSVSSIAAPVYGEYPARRQRTLAAIIIITLQLFAGHAQMSWYSALLAGTWVIAGSIVHGGMKKLVRSLGQLFAIYVAAILLAAIQLVPTAEYLMQSQRSSAVEYETALSYSFWPWRLISLIAPDFFGNPGTGTYWGYGNYWEDANYIGVLPLLLAFSTLTKFRSRNKLNDPENRFRHRPLLLFCWIMLPAAFILALGRNLPVFPFLYDHIPTFSLFNGPTRFMVIFTFCCCLLAGLAADRLKFPAAKQMRMLKRATVAGVAITLGALGAWIAFRNIDVSFIRAAALAGFWAVGTGVMMILIPRDDNKDRRAMWNWGVVFLIGIDLVTANSSLIQTIDRDFYKASNQIESSVVKNMNVRVFLAPEDEYAVKYSRFIRFRSFEPLEAWENMRTVILPNLNILDQISSANNFDPFVPARYSLLMEQSLPFDFLANLSVGVVHRRAVDQPLGIEPITLSNALKLSKRVRMLGCPTAVVSTDQALEELHSAWQVGNYAHVVIETDQAIDCTNVQDAEVKLVKDFPGEVEIGVNSSEGGWLFIPDTWYPGWKAFLNSSIEMDIFPANINFRSVLVPPGQHTIKLIYSPDSFSFGTILSALSWLVLIVTVIYTGLKRRNRHKELS